MSNMSYSPYGNTFCRVVTAASQAVPTPTIVPAPTAIAPIMCELDYRVSNIGTQTVFIATAVPGATAPTATIPGDGTNAAVLLIAPNETRTFSFQYGTQFAAIAAATGSTLYISCGDGVAL